MAEKKNKKTVENRANFSSDRINENTPFDIKESYKTVRTNILFSLVPSNKKTVVITSAIPGEGKSTTAGNLAITMAETGAKVMLVDGDLRKPVQHKFFQVENTKGLSNLLVGFDSVSDSVKRNVVPNLDLVTAGALPPNPSELLGSKNMSIFIQKMEEYYDYIIIDTPPVNIVTDAVALANQTAGIVLVARSGYAPRESIQLAAQTIEQAGCKILGIVLSDVSPENNKQYYRSKYYKYGGKYSYKYGYGKSGYGYGYGYSYGKPRERKQDTNGAPDNSSSESGND